MGRVLVEAKIEHMGDVYNSSQGTLPPEKIRSLVVKDALVDTGAWGLSMPKSQIAQLNLPFVNTRKAMTAAGLIDVNVYGAVRLTIQDRQCPMDVTEGPDGCPVLIGQIPLEAMDFVVDMRSHTVTGNPRHGGEHIIELFSHSLAYASGS